MRTMIFIFFIALFLACNDSQLQSELIRLQQENISLKTQNDSLLQEIQKLKETDQYYYQSGVDAYRKGDFEQAINWLTRLKAVFPLSPLIPSSYKIIRDSKSELASMYQREKQELDRLIRESNRQDIEIAISNHECPINLKKD